MKLQQLVAGAAVGRALTMTGIGLASGVANAAPPCNPAPPQAQCGPGGPSPQRGAEGRPPGDFRGPDNHDWRPSAMSRHLSE